jgi:hypothetical protein
MGIDDDFNDTILHVSGNIMKDRIKTELHDHIRIRYIVPGKKAA